MFDSEIPKRDSGSFFYVLLEDIPEPVQSAFQSWLFGQTCPVIEGEGSAAYWGDFEIFLEGGKISD